MNTLRRVPGGAASVTRETTHRSVDPGRPLLHRRWDFHSAVIVALPTRGNWCKTNREIQDVGMSGHVFLFSLVDPKDFFNRWASTMFRVLLVVPNHGSVSIQICSCLRSQNRVSSRTKDNRSTAVIKPARVYLFG